jgi:hypothetical protein
MPIPTWGGGLGARKCAARGKGSLAWNSFIMHTLTRSSQVTYMSELFLISVIDRNMLGVLCNNYPLRQTITFSSDPPGKLRNSTYSKLGHYYFFPPPSPFATYFLINHSTIRFCTCMFCATPRPFLNKRYRNK